MKNLSTNLLSRIALILALNAIITPASADDNDTVHKKSMVQEILLDLKINAENLFNIEPIQVQFLKQPLRIPPETEVESKVVTNITVINTVINSGVENSKPGTSKNLAVSVDEKEVNEMNL